MTQKELRFEPVDLGNGISAVGVWPTDSPIVLIDARSSGRQVRARLDMQKAMFLDALPGERSESGVRMLIQQVMKVARFPNQEMQAR